LPVLKVRGLKLRHSENVNSVMPVAPLSTRTVCQNPWSLKQSTPTKTTVCLYCR